MTIEFNYELEIEGHLLQVNIHAEARVYTDNYGADADGNRGEARTFIENLNLKVTDQRDNDITKGLDIRHCKQFQKLEHEAELRMIEQFEEGLDYEEEYY